MQALNFEDVISNLCILPGSNKQLININSLVSEDALLIASFFDQENLEYTESQILSMPQNGYDEINSFAEKFTKLPDFPSQVLSLNSRTFALSSKIINENFSANLKTLVILELSSSAEILKRTFNF